MAFANSASAKVNLGAKFVLQHGGAVEAHEEKIAQRIEMIRRGKEG
jgi:hypothetical protein